MKSMKIYLDSIHLLESRVWKGVLGEDKEIDKSSGSLSAMFWVK